MFGKAKIKNSNVSKKGKFRIPIFENRRNLTFQCLEKANIQNSNLSKKAKFRISVSGKGKIWNSNNWKKPKF